MSLISNKLVIFIAEGNMLNAPDADHTFLKP